MASTVYEEQLINAKKILAHIPLKKFCVKKLYEIELITPLTKKDEKFVKELVEIGKKFEPVSDIHFIDYEDVLDLTERLSHKKENVDLPRYVKECAEVLLMTKLMDKNLPVNQFLAIMTKVKVIETMYKIYKQSVIKMQQRNKVRDELNVLLYNWEPENKKRSDKKKAKKKKEEKKSNTEKSKTSKKFKKESKKSSPSISKQQKSTEISVDDYTEIVLEENDLIFDSNVDNHLAYFVLSGFSDPFILQELTKIKAEISGIIDISVNTPPKGPLKYFISKLQELHEMPVSTEFLEDTVWMKYRSNDENPSKENLEEFLYVVKKINYIKRQHLYYLKELKLYDFGPQPKKIETACLEKYHKIMNCYPQDFVTIPLIMDALIQEVCWREQGAVYSLSYLTSSSESFQSMHKQKKSYQVHEQDLLKIGLEEYTHNRKMRLCYDKTLEYLEKIEPLKSVTFPTLKKKKQSRSVATEEYCYCGNFEELLDFFHLAMFSQMKRKEILPRKIPEYDFTVNLVTYDEETDYKKHFLKGGDAYKVEKNIFQNYQMKENLSTSVLRQLIFSALQNYSTWDRLYCEETGSILLKFHDNLNEFGVDTKISNQHLRTPVCLRDFCRYVANDEKRWLEENKLVKHEDLIDGLQVQEKCEGLGNIPVPELYQEYGRLLEAPGHSDEENNKKILEDILDELNNYPKNGTQKTFCREEGSFLTYDLGPKRCQLTGHTTVFRSDYGVKVSIDTTRFTVEQPKCTVNLEADGNSLVFHSNRPSNFHFILKNDIIINLNIPKSYDVSNEYETKTAEKLEDSVMEEKKTKFVENNSNDWIQVLRKRKLAASNCGKKNPISDNIVKLDEKSLNRLLELFKQAEKSFYKMSTKPSVCHLKRISTTDYVPLFRTLKRVLFKPVQKKRKIRGYSVLQIPKLPKTDHLKYDFQITHPNGLVITTLRSKPVAEVKQEYTFNNFTERYRTFHASGTIIIKNSDGSINIYRSNGEIITFTEQKGSRFDCAEHTKHAFGKKAEENCPFGTTRCKSGHTETNPINFIDLNEFGDIPYTQKSILEFNGKFINISDNVLTEKQLYYVLNENDYHTEETFYEREDGMKCIIDKKGQRVFQFPDRTKITAWPEIEKDLIFVSKNPKIEGWVSVVVNYKIEHPDYIAVMYNNLEKSTQLFLNGGVVKNGPDRLTATTNDNIALEVTSDSITFLKFCEQCDGDCVCKIHLHSGAKLLEVYDSSEKYFCCDKFGKCEISCKSNKKAKCQHFSKDEEEKFFILNAKGPPGTLFWKNSSIENKIMKGQNCKNVKILNYVNKLSKKQNLEFLTEVYQHFNSRFTMSQIDHNICLSKYKNKAVSEKPAFYVTFRILTEIHNLKEHPETLSELESFLESIMGQVCPALLEGIKQLVSYFTSHQDRDVCSYRMSIQPSNISEFSSNSSKSIYLEKITVQDVIANWKQERDNFRHLIRNTIFPPYFHSEYCSYIFATLGNQSATNKNT